MKYEEIENNIKNYETHMTIYFDKETGKIISWCTGLNNMNYFTGAESCFRKILDYEIFELDNFVLDNASMFIVQNRELRLLPKPKKQKYAYAEVEETEEAEAEAVEVAKIKKPTVGAIVRGVSMAVPKLLEAKEVRA